MKRHKMVTAIIIIVIVATFLWFLFGGSGKPWQSAEAKAAAGSLPLWDGEIDWDGFAAAVKVDCGGNGSEADTTAPGQCWMARSEKLQAFFKGMNVKPTGTAFTTLKKYALAYEKDSNTPTNPTSVTIGEFVA